MNLLFVVGDMERDAGRDKFASGKKLNGRKIATPRKKSFEFDFCGFLVSMECFKSSLAPIQINLLFRGFQSLANGSPTV